MYRHNVFTRLRFGLVFCKYFNSSWLVLGIAVSLSMTGLALAQEENEENGAEEATVSDGSGDNRASQMLELLKQREYFELADHFLERLASSSSISDPWKTKIPFERAAVLIQVASTSQSEDVDRRLDEARRMLKQFVESNPGSSLTDDANMELAKLRMAQGKRAVARAETTEDPAAKNKLLKEAGTAFRSAETQFRQRKNVLEALRKDAAATAEMDQAAIDKMRTDFLFSRMTVALLEFEQAKLLRGNQKKYNEQIKSALEEFEKISKEFRERLIGLEAIYYQGFCYEEIGQYETALDYYEQLIQLAELPESLSSRTLSRIVHCYVQLQQPEKAIKRGEIWLARGGERLMTPDAMEVCVGLSEAYVIASQAESSRDQKKYVKAARTQLMRVLKIPGPHILRARSILATLPAAPVKKIDPSDANDFSSAKIAADQQRDQMQSTTALVDLQRRKLETAEDEERRAAAQAELEAAEQNSLRFRTAALAQYRQALGMATQETPADELNDVRYMVAFLHYQMSQHMEAAVVAEFVAERFSNTTHAKDCANIAMACYWAMYQQASAEDRAFETERMIRIADLIASKWPGGKEATGALVNLVNLTITQGDAAKAEEYLNRIPQDSSARVAAELRTGVGLWRLSAKQTAAESAEVGAETRSRATSLLESGIEKSREAEPDAIVAQAALALAQIKTQFGSPTEALALLRDPKLGPKTLVDQKHVAVTATGFVEQTYRVLLKAIIGQLAEGNAKADDAINEATATMDALKELVGDSPEGQRRLAATYVALAQDLRAQIDTAEPASKAKLKEGFIAFLDRVAESSDSLKTRHWVAETFLGMADDMVASEGSGKIPAEARKFYEGSLATFEALVAMPDDTEGMSPEVRTRLKLQTAMAMRRLEKHKEALDLFEAILKDRNRVINVQVEAAATYQEAGSFGSNNLYELAIKGARKNEESANTIWGWEKLAKVAAGQMKRGPEQEKQFAELFFQSRFNIAECRLKQAARASGDERANFVRQATRAIKLTRSLYPEMGGEAWKAKFEELAGKINAL